MTTVDKDSAEQQAAQSFTGETLDSWSWIGRARAAARRAVESATSPEEPPRDREAPPRDPIAD
jgi:hypothetical protein